MAGDASGQGRDVLSRVSGEWCQRWAEEWAERHLPRERDRLRFVNCEKAPADQIVQGGGPVRSDRGRGHSLLPGEGRVVKPKAEIPVTAGRDTARADETRELTTHG